MKTLKTIMSGIIALPLILLTTLLVTIVEFAFVTLLIIRATSMGVCYGKSMDIWAICEAANDMLNHINKVTDNNFIKEEEES